MSGVRGPFIFFVFSILAAPAFGQQQIVTPEPVSQFAGPGQAVSFYAIYTTEPADPAVTGLGLRIHYDSSKLTFVSLTNVLATGLVSQSQPQADTGNQDADPFTDRVVLVAWADVSGNWPGTLPETLFLANFTTAAGFNSGSTAVNFTASSTAAGFTFASTPAETASTNSFFGYRSGLDTTSGAGNSFFGFSSGLSNTTESNNTFIGARSTGVPGITNATALGYRAQVSQSNSLVLGGIAGVNDAPTSVNVGIGTPAPQRQLHLKGNNAVFRMDRDTDTAAFMIVRTTAGGTPLKTFVVGTNAFAPGNGEFIVNDLGSAVGGPGVRRMTITNAGEAHFTGTVRAPAFVETSSLRYKENVTTLRDAPDMVGRLRGVRFNWRETGKPSVGLIAEEVAEVLPEVVAWENDGLETAGVNYAALVAVLVEALKEQRREIQSLRAELTGLKALEAGLAELRDLKTAVQELRALRALPPVGIETAAEPAE
jgi:hypothetical protein